MQRKGMVVVILLPILDFKDLLRCNMVCRAFSNLITPKKSDHVLNYENYFLEQGQTLTED